MSTTEPEFDLVGVAPVESDSHPSPSFWGLAGRALFGSASGVVLSVLLGVLLLEGSYAGAREDATAQQAISAYQPFLLLLGRRLAWIGVAEALCFAPVVLGWLLLLRAHPRSAPALGGRVLLPLLLGSLVVFAFGAGVAHRHPGLFLPLLSSSRVWTLSASGGHWVAALVFGGATCGYLLTALRQRRRPRVVFACASALLLPVLVGWSGSAVPPSWLPPSSRVFGARTIPVLPPVERERPNVLLLAVDSLRPDMIDAQHTPHLNELLAQSVYFPNALVTQPRTGPSWAATLTSLPPLANGVETMFPSASQSQLTNLALPAHLAALGYRTAAFSEYAGEFFSRVNFGFQVNAVPSVELKEIAGQMLMMRTPSLLAAASVLYTQGPLGRFVLGKRMTRLVRGMANFASPQVLQDDMLALASFDQPQGDGTPVPYFWLAFYSQPHFPYTSSSDFYPDYHVAGSSPELTFGRDAANETPITSPEDQRQLVGLYRAALAETDAAIGQLLERLNAAGQLEKTIIVLLADHGEGLYECATCVGHGDNLKSLVTLRVPLAFRLPPALFPRAAPSRHEGYVSQLDVYPTLLSLLGEHQLAHHAGLPLLERSGRVRALPARTHLAETGEWLWPTPAVPDDRIAYPVITEMAKLDRGRIVIDSQHGPEIRAAKQRSVIRPPYKLNYEPGAQRVQYHLYQFEQDPWETEDLAAAQPELVLELKRELFRSMLRHPQVLSVADYFLTRPDGPPPEFW